MSSSYTTLSKLDKHSPPDISIIIVSWNVAKLLADCIRSILDTAGELAVEIIVVDNNSADGTVQMLHDRFPTVNVIANQENAGFSKANNQGLDLANGRYIFFLNPDTVLQEGVLAKLALFLDKNPLYGMAGPRLVFPHGSVQYTCARRLPSLMTDLVCESLHLCRIQYLRRKLKFPYDHAISQEVEAISGAAMLIRRHILEEIGGFDENFTHTREDLELCFRLKKYDWRIFYVSDAEIVHYEGTSSAQAPVRVIVNATLSGQHYFDVCYGKWHGYIYRLTTMFIKLPALVVGGVIKFFLRVEGRKKLQQRLQIATAILRGRTI